MRWIPKLKGQHKAKQGWHDKPNQRRRRDVLVAAGGRRRIGYETGQGQDARNIAEDALHMSPQACVDPGAERRWKAHSL
jgi:hypothetical protein